MHSYSWYKYVHTKKQVMLAYIEQVVCLIWWFSIIVGIIMLLLVKMLHIFVFDRCQCHIWKWFMYFLSRDVKYLYAKAPTRGTFWYSFIKIDCTLPGSMANPSSWDLLKVPGPLRLEPIEFCSTSKIYVPLIYTPNEISTELTLRVNVKEK